MEVNRNNDRQTDKISKSDCDCSPFGLLYLDFDICLGNERLMVLEH